MKQDNSDQLHEAVANLGNKLGVIREDIQNLKMASSSLLNWAWEVAARDGRPQSYTWLAGRRDGEFVYTDVEDDIDELVAYFAGLTRDQQLIDDAAVEQLGLPAVGC